MVVLGLVMDGILAIQQMAQKLNAMSMLKKQREEIMNPPARKEPAILPVNNPAQREPPENVSGVTPPPGPQDLVQPMPAPKSGAVPCRDAAGGRAPG